MPKTKIYKIFSVDELQANLLLCNAMNENGDYCKARAYGTVPGNKTVKKGMAYEDREIAVPLCPKHLYAYIKQHFEGDVDTAKAEIQALVDFRINEQIELLKIGKN